MILLVIIDRVALKRLLVVASSFAVGDADVSQTNVIMTVNGLILKVLPTDDWITSAMLDRHR